MGLKCSVLGHRYGDPEYVEERDRQGSEVVLTAQEVKTCKRCGDTLVVSESKEVTSIEEPTPEPAQPETPTPEPEPAEAPEVPEVEEAHQQNAEEDDGIILEDEPEGREPGQWPEVETGQDEEPADPDNAWPSVDPGDEVEESDPPPGWPDARGEDAGFDAVAGDVDDELADEVVEAVQAPKEPAGEETASGFFRAEPIGSPGDPDEGSLRTEYFCPQCDWTAPSLTTSVRRGDVCPGCQKGYLAERDDA